jgi:hypothetical protein
MPPLFSFNILSYRVNPFFTNPGVSFQLLPVPGFSGTSYSITGTLPAGVTFSTVSGVFTGPATSLTPATTLVVTGNLAGGGSSQCTVIMEITDIPVPAIEANIASAIGLVDSKLIAMQNFIASAESMINNNNLLGRYSATLILPDYVNFKWVYFYFTKLNYTVENLNPSNSDDQFNSFFGGLPSFPGFFDEEWGGPNYNDFTQFPATVRSNPPRRARIAWSPFTGYRTFPYGF